MNCKHFNEGGMCEWKQIGKRQYWRKLASLLKAFRLREEDQQIDVFCKKGECDKATD